MKKIIAFSLIYVSLSCQIDRKISINPFEEKTNFIDEVKKYKILYEDIELYNNQLQILQNKYKIPIISSDFFIDITKNNIIDKNKYESSVLDESCDIYKLPINSFFIYTFNGNNQYNEFETRNLKPINKKNTPDTRMYLLKGHLRNGEFNTIDYNDDFDNERKSKLNAIYLYENQIYTLIIHSYDIESSGICDLYNNNKIFKSNIYFGGQTFYKIIDYFDIIKSENVNNGLDTLFIICIFDEEKKYYEVIKYNDDNEKSLGFNYQIKDNIHKKGYILVGAYSSLNIGFINLKLIKGHIIDGFQK